MFQCQLYRKLLSWWRKPQKLTRNRNTKRLSLSTSMPLTTSYMLWNVSQSCLWLPLPLPSLILHVISLFMNASTYTTILSYGHPYTLQPTCTCICTSFGTGNIMHVHTCTCDLYNTIWCTASSTCVPTAGPLKRDHLWVLLCSFCTDEAHGERSKDSIRGKCTQYLERAEQLKKYVQKKNKKVHSSGGTASKETKKWV